MDVGWSCWSFQSCCSHAHMTRTSGQMPVECDGCKRLYLPSSEDIDCNLCQRILLLRSEIYVSEKERIILKGDKIREKFHKAHFSSKKKRVYILVPYRVDAEFR